MKKRLVIFIILILVFVVCLLVKVSRPVSAAEPSPQLAVAIYPDSLTAEQMEALQSAEGYQSYEHYMVWAVSVTGGMEYLYMTYDACNDTALFTGFPNKPFGSGRLLVMSSTDGLSWTVKDDLTNGSNYYFRSVYTLANGQELAGSLLYSDCDLYWGDSDTPFFTAFPMASDDPPALPEPSGDGDVVSALPCLLGIIFGGLCFSALRWWR